MNIKRINLQLAGEDLLSMAKDFVDVEGLTIEKIVTDNKIHISGFYKKVFCLSFKISIGIINVNNNRVFALVDSVSIGKIGIFSWINKFVLKVLSKALRDKGIDYVSGVVSVNIDKILKLIPFGVKLNIKALKLMDRHLEVEVENFSFSLRKEEKNEEVSVAMVREEVDIEAGKEKSIAKVEDVYTRVRVKVETNMPDKYSELVDYLMLLPDIITLFYRLFRDKRVPLRIKAIVGGIMTYLVLPIDIVPDFIPFVGKIDDMALAFYALDKIINAVPENIIKENWQGREDIIVKGKEAVDFLNKAAGGTNVGKLINFIRKMTLEY